MKKRYNSTVYYSDFLSKRHLIVYAIVISVTACMLIVAHTIINNALKSCTNSTVNATTQHLRAKLYSLGARQIHFKSVDGQKLEGLAFYRPAARWTMLVCHGYQSNKEAGWRLVKMFTDCNIVLFDFRGHGQSSSSIISFGWHEYNDVLAALQFIHANKEFKQLPVLGIGFSMGGAALLNAVAHGGSCKALIIDSTFESLDAQIKRIFKASTKFPVFPFYYVSNLMFYRSVGCFMHSINCLEWAKQITTPTMVIHSKNDDLTNHLAAPKILNAFKGSKEAWYPDDAPHALSIKIYQQEYKQRVLSFVEKYVLTVR